MKSYEDIRHVGMPHSFFWRANFAFPWYFPLKACILVKTETGKHGSVAKKLSQLNGIRTCFPVLGQADVVVKIEVRDIEELTRSVREILSLRGVSETETLVESGA